MFSLSRLRLEVEASDGNEAARAVLALREDPNAVLTTILWGNVGINVLLTLLSDSVLAGASAFLFSTFAITLFGEIAPQAYFSRHALRMASLLSPLLRFYSFVLYPVVKPSALFLDAWLGREGVQFYRESHLKEVIRRHMEAEETDLDRMEAIGALNFLTIDDLPIVSEGVPVDPASILTLATDPLGDGFQFPALGAGPDTPFIQDVNRSGQPWVVLVDERERPRLMLDADGFLRHALLDPGNTNPMDFCHRPVIVRHRETPLGKAIGRLTLEPGSNDPVIDRDIILVWGDERRIITGADILGRLLRGTVGRRKA